MFNPLRALREGFVKLVDGMSNLLSIAPPEPVKLPKFKRRKPEDDAKKLAQDWKNIEGDLAKAFEDFKKNKR